MPELIFPERVEGVRRAYLTYQQECARALEAFNLVLNPVRRDIGETFLKIVREANIIAELDWPAAENRVFVDTIDRIDFQSEQKLPFDIGIGGWHVEKGLLKRNDGEGVCAYVALEQIAGYSGDTKLNPLIRQFMNEYQINKISFIGCGCGSDHK